MSAECLAESAGKSRGRQVQFGWSAQNLYRRRNLAGILPMHPASVSRMPQDTLGGDAESIGSWELTP